MTGQLSVVLVGLAVALTAFPAHARFGKKSSGSAPSSSSSSTHEAQPVNAPSSPPQAQSSGRGYSGGYARGPRARYGYWSAAFVPAYSVGYGYDAAPQPSVVVAQPVAEEPAPESPGIRLSAGIEGQGYRNGVTLGAAVGLEGDRWGFFATGQNIAVLADDGTNRFDHIQVATAHLSFAFLTGRYGRMRFEGGADAVFAPNLIVIGPTGGLSGTVWIGGPFALEGSAMVSPWPYRQFDGKLGLALGLGPLGLRAGFRAQLLDDRGLVDGVIHQDAFVGPYVGASLVF